MIHLDDLCEKIDKRLDYLKQSSIYILSFFNEIEEYSPIIIGGFIRDSIDNKD